MPIGSSCSTQIQFKEGGTVKHKKHVMAGRWSRKKITEKKNPQGEEILARMMEQAEWMSGWERADVECIKRGKGTCYSV